MTHKISIIGFILSVIKPFRFWVMAQFAVAIIWAIDFSLRPFLLKIIINKIPSATSETAIAELAPPLVFYLGMSLIVMIIFRFHDYLCLNLNPPLKRHVADILMKRMMKHSLSMFQNHFAGNLANKVKDVMNNIPDLLQVSLNQFLAHFLALAIAIFTLSTVSYKFSILLSVWVIFFVIGSSFFLKKAKKLSYEAAEVSSRIVGQIVDILSNIASVYLFSSKKNESKKLKTHLDRSVVAEQNRDWWFLYIFSFQSLSFLVYQIIAFTLLIYGYKDGTVTAGDFAMIISLNIGIIDILWVLSRDTMKFSQYWGNISQGLNIALAPIEIEDAPRALELKITKGSIEFKQVKFHYKGTNPLFEDKSVTIEAGQKVGLVGYSGSGKTTFVNLILRLHDLTNGQILIDGQDIAKVTQDSLREGIAMIPQDPSLFHRTLMDNIRYGRGWACDKEVIQAARRSHAHEFIEKLPEGYGSLVGERGVKLSGGQRQRIAIARAVLKNAPILILDEATSQLDSLTESDIQESMWDLMQNKTTLVIAHRLSTLMHMDRILVFDQGKIVEDGSHQELLAKNGLYKTLWSAQVDGFLPESRDNKI